MYSNSTLAIQFVELVERYADWRSVSRLPEESVELLFNIVSAAAFNPQQLLLGRLYEPYRDHKDTYPVNPLCPYKVVGAAGDDYFATGWLNCLLFRASTGLRSAEVRRFIVKAIETEIERSVPFKPIQLTPSGDLLLETEGVTTGYGMSSGRYFVDHLRDQNEFPWLGPIGTHAVCGGLIYHNLSVQASIKCDRCTLEVQISKGITTYGQLRAWLVPGSKVAQAYAERVPRRRKRGG